MLKGAYFVTENYIRQSGIPYTICQIGLYADIIPFFIGEALPVQGINFPSGDGKASFAMREEMGEAIANLMSKDSNTNASYTLTGNRIYSCNDIAQILTELSGKPIAFHSPEQELFVSQLKEYGAGENEIMFATLFGTLIKNEEYAIADSTLEQLLGRKPTTIEDYLKSTYFPAS